jgi:hypothetical protein
LCGMVLANYGDYLNVMKFMTFNAGHQLF